MTGLEEIATKAVLSIAGSAASAVAGKVSAWIKAKLSPAAGRAADALAEKPESKGAQRSLEGALLTELENNPTLAEELRALLAESGVSFGDQTATASGGSTVVQIQGQSNSVTTGRGG